MKTTEATSKGMSNQELDAIMAILEPLWGRPGFDAQANQAMIARGYRVVFDSRNPQLNRVGAVAMVDPDGVAVIRTPAVFSLAMLRDVLSHESVHRDQVNSAFNTGNAAAMHKNWYDRVGRDALNHAGYQKDPHEAMAYARTMIDQWRAQGVTTGEAERRLHAGWLHPHIDAQDDKSRKAFLRHAWDYAKDLPKGPAFQGRPERHGGWRPPAPSPMNCEDHPGGPCPKCQELTKGCFGMEFCDNCGWYGMGLRNVTKIPLDVNNDMGDTGVYENQDKKEDQTDSRAQKPRGHRPALERVYEAVPSSREVGQDGQEIQEAKIWALIEKVQPNGWDSRFIGSFVRALQSLPPQIQDIAKKKFKQWSLNAECGYFHQVGKAACGVDARSIRVTDKFIAVGRVGKPADSKHPIIVWFWIGNIDYYHSHLNDPKFYPSINKAYEAVGAQTKTPVNEMPINTPGDWAINPIKKRRIETERHPMAKNPAFPKGRRDAQRNYSEDLASQSYRMAVDKLRRYTGVDLSQGRTPDIRRLPEMMFGAIQMIPQIEARHRRELEAAAVDLVLDMPEFQGARAAIEAGELRIDAKLERPTAAGFRSSQDPEDEAAEEEIGQQRQEQDRNDEQDDNQMSLGLDDNAPTAEQADAFMGDLDMESAKRRVLNMMIQSMAMGKNYAYHMISDKLNAIDPRLLNLYGLVMSIGDHGFWTYPPQVAQDLGGGGGGGDFLGKEEIKKEDDDVIVIKARAVIFPVLVHEIVKGLAEYVAFRGTIEGGVDSDTLQHTFQQEDVLNHEEWDMMFGPAVWQRVLDYIGRANLKFVPHVMHRLAEAPASEFNKVINAVIAGKPDGKQWIERVVDELKQESQSPGHIDAKDEEDDGESWKKG